jgi:hypothetical protein
VFRTVLFFLSFYTDYAKVNGSHPEKETELGGGGGVGTMQWRNFKLLKTPGFEFKDSIPPAYVAWRASTTTLFLLGS